MPHTDNNNEPRYCTTIECNNNTNGSNISNILINSSSVDDNNDSKCLNESSAYENVAMNGNAFDICSNDGDDNNENEQSDIIIGNVTTQVNDEMNDNNLLAPDDEASAINLLTNQCGSTLDSGGDPMIVVESAPYTEQTNACEEYFASASSNVAPHSNEITEHSIDGDATSAIEIVVHIPTPSNTICHESNANTDEQNFNCDENNADEDYGDADEEEVEEEEEAIFHFLGKANEIVRLYTI